MRGCPLVNMYFPGLVFKLFTAAFLFYFRREPPPPPGANACNSRGLLCHCLRQRRQFRLQSGNIEREASFCFFNSTPLFLSSKSEFSGRQSWARSRVSQNPKFKFFFASQASFLGEKRGGGLSHPSLSSEVCCWWC